jgi:cobalamin biosynthesis protein CobW
VTVDGVVAVADGEALADGRVAHDMGALAEQRAADDALDHDDPIEEVFEDQIACADLVILSKTDLLSADQIGAASSHLSAHLARAVKIVPAAAGSIDAQVLLGLGAAAEADIDNRRTHHDDDLDHEHDDFDSFIVELAATADADSLVARVTAAGELPDVLRIKGFADVDGKPMRLLVQAVGARVQSHFDRPWKADEQRSTRLVVIGLHGLDRARVEAVLAA